MLKIEKLIICIVIGLSLASCCLNKKDRDLVNKASIDAREAKILAEDAVIEASIAVEKSERMFKQLHKK
jgi:hypothetical protein|tara:strand:- start:52 stop:258 length:207 start_codon:yes stop_codon:yes gene_type:complete